MNDSSKKTQFLTILEQNKGMIHKVALIYTSTQADREDLYQEICLQLWRSYGMFRGESKISTWIYRVALNTAISTIRRNKRKVTTLELDPSKNYIARDSGSEEATVRLLRAIECLGKIDRGIILLWLEEKRYDEIAEIMGMSRQAVSVRIVRIKRKLEETIKKLKNE